MAVCHLVYLFIGVHGYYAALAGRSAELCFVPVFGILAIPIMKASAFKYTVLSTVASLIMVIIAVIPFHAFLTVWAASYVGHYTAIRLWKEVLLAACGLGVLYLIVVDATIRTLTLTRRLAQLIVLFCLVQLVWGLFAYHAHDVSAKALGYGWLVDMRFFIFFLIVWAIALRTSRLQTHWIKLLLWPSVIVIGFGLLQVFVLPTDFLKHFGYSAATIPPYQTINHNIHYVRIFSTLRGANPLGAYLLIPLSALAVLLVRGVRTWQTISLFIADLIVLFFSYSRSAYIGAGVSLAVVVLVGMKNRRVRRSLLIGGGVLGLAAVIAVVALHNNPHFDNIAFHTQSHSNSPRSSDQGHASALQAGLHDLVQNPLGKGPGSAGPASVYNNHPARIAENFYVQIGQETGWIGLILFLTINVGVGYLLWLARRSSLALALLASLLGLSVVNILSHAWADDTLAYVWWGLAGIAIATLPHGSDLAPEVSTKPNVVSPAPKHKRVKKTAKPAP
jgi:hypothetical protein